MKFLRWLGRKIRGPGWYLWNIAQACWFLHLRDMAEKPGQTRLKRTAYRLVITIELLLSVAFIFCLLQGLSQVVIFTLAFHYLYTELGLTWFRPVWPKITWGKP